MYSNKLVTGLSGFSRQRIVIYYNMNIIYTSVSLGKGSTKGSWPVPGASLITNII